MVSLLDLNWLSRCARQLHEMAEDPDTASRVLEALDANEDLRDELPHIYIKALKTVRSSRQE